MQKKALTTLKAPKSEQPEPVPIVSRKRHLDSKDKGKDAKEMAKKLLLQGKITAIRKPGKFITFALQSTFFPISNQLMKS
jgi:hypothetical protein